jgi:hypothetical protein
MAVLLGCRPRGGRNALFGPRRRSFSIILVSAALVKAICSLLVDGIPEGKLRMSADEEDEELLFFPVFLVSLFSFFIRGHPRHP